MRWLSMKLIRNCILLLAVVQLYPDMLHAQQLRFLAQKSFDSVIASKNNKLIFIDFYTTWCGPCKRMDKEVFSDSAVARQVLNNFLPIKVDAEKGNGLSLAARYNITSYPTYLFLNAKGVPVYRTNGYMPVNEFKGQLKNALSESTEKITILELDSLYTQNSTDTNFLYQYLSRRTRLRLDNSDLLDRYISLVHPSNRGTTEHLQLIIENGGQFSKSLQIGPALETLIQHQQKLSELQKALSIDYYMENARRKTLSKAIYLQSDSLLQLVLQYIPDNDVFNNQSTTKLSYYAQTGQTEEYYDEANKYMENQLTAYPLKRLFVMDSVVLQELLNSEDFKESTPEEISELKQDYRHTQSIRAVRLYNTINDQLLQNLPARHKLMPALTWASRALAICEADTNYFRNILPHSLSTYAQLLFNIGNKTKAIQLQTRAVQLAGKLEDKEDLTKYRKQLVQMKLKKSSK